MKRVLILYLEPCCEESVNSLLSCFSSFERITIVTGCYTETAESDRNQDADWLNSFWETEGNEIREKIAQSELLLLPYISDEILKHMANGDVTCETEEWIMYALCLGKKVIAINSLPEEPRESCAAVKRYYSKRRQRLQDCGIDSVMMSELEDTIADKKVWKLKKLITNEDIIELHNNHRDEIDLSYGIRMTPLAMDTAKEFHMNIKMVNDNNVQDRR